MLLMVSLLRFTPIDESVITTNIEESFSATTVEFLMGIIREITIRATPGALLGAAGVSAIWAASRCLLSIIQGLNKVYSVDSKHSWVKLRLLSVVYVFVLQLMIIVSLGILVFGEQINSWLIAEFNLEILNQSYINLRWGIGFLLLILFFMFVYTIIPEKKKRFRKAGGRAMRNLPGAVLAAVGWLGFTGLFTMYIDHFTDFGAVYGSLTAAVILMLWLYFCMYILFVGAQFNVWLRRSSISSNETTPKTESTQKTP